LPRHVLRQVYIIPIRMSSRGRTKHALGRSHWGKILERDQKNTEANRNWGLTLKKLKERLAGDTPELRGEDPHL